MERMKCLFLKKLIIISIINSLRVRMDKNTYTCVITNLMHAIIVFKTLDKYLHSTPTSVNDSLPNQGDAETLVFA